jgi:hypothetical protein
MNIRDIRLGQPEKLAVAKHRFEKGHSINITAPPLYKEEDQDM